MSTRQFMLCVIVSASLLPGCSGQKMLADPFAFEDQRPSSTAKSGPPVQRTYATQDSQTGFRVQLLRDQLRHAELDLQSATTAAERQAVQERIDIIRQQLKRLDARR